MGIYSFFPKSNKFKRKFMFLFYLLIASAWQTYAYVHPGGMHPREQIRFVRQQIKHHNEPYFSAWRQLLNLSDSALSQEHHALADFSVPGYYQKPEEHERNSRSISKDAFNAYTCALAWQLSKEKKYADKAVYYINAWSSINKKYSEGDGSLVMCYNGTALVMAAELMSDYSGWGRNERELFKEWLTNVFRKAANEIREKKNNWADWGRFGSALTAYYLDDKAEMDENIRLFKSDVFDKIAEDGHMPQETRRGANGLWYTYFSLAPMTAMTWVAFNASGENLFALQKDGKSIKAALDYLFYYNRHPQEWKWFDHPNFGSPESKYSDLGLKTYYSFWPANLLEAMSGIFREDKYVSYVEPYRPLCYEEHHYAWVFTTLMPATLDGYKKNNAFLKAGFGKIGY